MPIDGHRIHLHKPGQVEIDVRGKLRVEVGVKMQHSRRVTRGMQVETDVAEHGGGVGYSNGFAGSDPVG